MSIFSLFGRCNKLFFVMLFCAMTGDLFAQQDPRDTPSDQSTETSVTIELIGELQKQIESAGDLDANQKTPIIELLNKAKQELENAATWTAEAKKFARLIETADSDAEQLRQDLEKPLTGFDFSSIEGAGLTKLTNEATQLQQQLAVVQDSLSVAQAELTKRADRRSKLPEEISKADQDKSEIDDQLKVKPDATIHPLAAAASKYMLLARRVALEAKLGMLDQEQKAYDARGTEYLQQRIDLLTRQVNQQTQDLRDIRSTIADRRKTDAKAQLEDARAILARLPESLADSDSAKSLIQLAEQRGELAVKIHNVEQDLQGTTKDNQALKADYDKTEARLSQGASSTMGELLVRKLRELPSEPALRRNLIARREAISASNSKLFRFEDRRFELSKQSIQPEWKITTLIPSISELHARPALIWPTSVWLWIETRRQIEQSEAKLLDDLIAETGQYFDLLVRANSAEQELIKQSREFERLIENNVFWVQSAPRFSFEDFSYIVPATQWFFDDDTWLEAGQSLLDDARSNPVPAVLFVLIWGMICVCRSRWKRKLVELGRAAESRSCRDFATTVKALALTVLLTLPGPMLIYYVAWRLSYSSSEFTAFVHALSDNLFSLAFYYLALEFMRQTFRSHGLAESHFEGYSPEIAKIYRRSLQVMIVVFLPAVFVGEIIRSSGVPAFDFTVGRLFFLIALLALVYAYDSVARPTRRRIQYFGDPDLAQRKWLSVLIYASILMLTAVAAVSALSGYYFGAWSLLKSCFHLMILMFLLMFVGSMLHRWVRVERRALAYQQAMERLARARETEEKEGSEIEDIIVDENEVDIRQIDDQSKRLIRSLTLIVGFFGLLWAIKDLLPALSILNQFQLWQKQSLDGAIVWVTLSDLLLAIVVFIITAQMTKNLPGLLEMLVFKRLNMDSSIRYAIGKLSSYTMAAVGIIVGFNLLGLTWSKAQWLIAALGVGLGFGLQEIFANFVAGIILLFERPIRVGDVITLGDTTGVVTRIQIRATTIRNWDRQDLVVPNRDLITNQFLNWTLSGTLNRIVFNVGVAYGSDIRKARSILLDILAEHPNVMDQPGPLVTFEEFGDSSLNLVVRAYLPEVDDRLSTIDGLHTVIHDRFAKAGIEIPFPQRDLHVRSIEDVVKTQAKEGSLESGFTTD